MTALAELLTDGNKWKFYSALFGCMVALVGFKILLGVSIRFVARRTLGGDVMALKGVSSSRKGSTVKTPKGEKEEGAVSRMDKQDVKKNQ